MKMGSFWQAKVKRLEVWPFAMGPEYVVGIRQREDSQPMTMSLLPLP